MQPRAHSGSRVHRNRPRGAVVCRRQGASDRHRCAAATGIDGRRRHRRAVIVNPCASGICTDFPADAAVTDGSVPANTAQIFGTPGGGAGGPVHHRAPGRGAVPQQLAAPALPFHVPAGPACTRSGCTPPTRPTTWSSTPATRRGRCRRRCGTRWRSTPATCRSGHRAQRAARRRTVLLGSEPSHFTIAPVAADRQDGLLVDVRARPTSTASRPAARPCCTASRSVTRASSRCCSAAPGRCADRRPGDRTRARSSASAATPRRPTARSSRSTTSIPGARCSRRATPTTVGTAPTVPRRRRRRRDRAAVGRHHHLLARRTGLGRRPHHGRAARHAAAACRASAGSGHGHGPAAGPGLVRPARARRRRT